MVNKLSGRRLVLGGLAATVLAATALIGWWGSQRSANVPEVQSRGGQLVATVRSEPRGFNRLVVRDRTSNLVSLLQHERLVRTNQATQQTEPALATSWTEAADGRTWTLKLREGVRFSDGSPFTSADVLFSFVAVFDERTGSPLAGSLEVSGRPIEASAPDEHTVVVTFPEPFGPGVRVLDNLPILPKHKLASHLADGTLRDAWGLTTPPAELVGLGPFVLTEYRPGERLVFTRNPHYWRRDERGGALPRLETLTLAIVPDQNAEMLRLESGEADLISGDVRPDDVVAVRKRAQQGTLQVFDVGVALDADFLWFNLQRGAAPYARAWLQRRELRQAISYGVDRRSMIDTVYLGAAVPVSGPVTPGNRDWYDATLPAYGFDPARARQLLAGLGLADRNGDGQLEAPDGTPARFALLTQKGNTIRERAAAFIQQDLGKLGLLVDVVTLEQPALIDRVTKGAYEAAFFGTQASDTDPASNLDFWTSGGAFHLWNPGQETAQTDWEARIDDLMKQQVASRDPAERRRLFNEVQRVFATELPAIYFAAPRVLLAASPRVVGITPGLLQPYILWDAATLGVRH